MLKSKNKRKVSASVSCLSYHLTSVTGAVRAEPQLSVRTFCKGVSVGVTQTNTARAGGSEREVSVRTLRWDYSGTG